MKRALLAVITGAWTVAACAGIIGIEELPVRPQDGGTRDGTSPAVDAADSGGGSPACDESPAAGCSCKHAFCDDFDDDAAIGDKWRSTLTPGGGPFTRGRTDGGVFAGQGPEAVSAPHSFETKLFSDDGPSYAVLFNKLAHQRGPSFQGVRFRFLSRVRELSMTENAGPIDGGSVLLGGLMTESIPPAGVVLAIAPGGVYLSAADDDVLTGQVATITPVYEGNVLSLSTLVVTIDLYVVTRERAIAEGFADPCKDVTTPTVAAARVAGLTAACMALPPELADIKWTSDGVVGLGAGMFGQGTTRVLHDNAMVDYFE